MFLHLSLPSAPCTAVICERTPASERTEDCARVRSGVFQVENMAARNWCVKEMKQRQREQEKGRRKASKQGIEEGASKNERTKEKKES